MREEKWIDFEKQARKQIREACARLVFFRDGNLGDNPDPHRKILFILKEPNNSKGCQGCSESCQYKDKPMIDNRKAPCGFHNRSREGDLWNRLFQIAERLLKEDDDAVIGNSISIINLKKIGGGSTTASKLSVYSGSYEDHAEKLSDELKEQIAEICPEIIFCCGTYGCAMKNLLLGETLECVSSAEYISVHRSIDGKKVIVDAWHPTAPKLKNVENWKNYLSNVESIAF